MSEEHTPWEDADAKHWYQHYTRLRDMYNKYRVMLIEELDIPEKKQCHLNVFGGVRAVRNIIRKRKTSYDQDQKTIAVLVKACKRAQNRLRELGQNESCRTNKVLAAAISKATS